MSNEKQATTTTAMPQIMGATPAELTVADIDNIRALLGRVSLKGSEAKTYVGIDMKLAYMRELQPPVPAE